MLAELCWTLQLSIDDQAGSTSSTDRYCSKTAGATIRLRSPLIFERQKEEAAGSRRPLADNDQARGARPGDRRRALQRSTERRTPCPARSFGITPSGAGRP